MIYLIILSIFVNLIIFLNITKLADVIRIYDIPDQNRKLHKKKSKLNLKSKKES